MSLYKDASLVMIPSAYKDGKLYSIRPTDGSGDFTFSRGSNLAATRVDVNGLIEKGRENLFTNSNNLPDVTLDKLTRTTGHADPFGGMDAALFTENTATGSHRFYIFNIPASDAVHTYSIYAKPNGRDRFQIVADGGGINAQWNISTGTLIGDGNEITSNIESVGNGWYRLSLTYYGAGWIGGYFFNDSGSNSYTGDGTSGVYIYGAQVELGLVATDYIETGTSAAQSGILEDMPRLDYSGSCPSLLLEPQRSNLITQSEYVDSWLKYNCTINSNAVVSPEGKQNAHKIVENTSLGYHAVYLNNVFTADGTYKTASVFVKAAGRNFCAISTRGAFGSSDKTLIFNLTTGEWAVNGSGQNTGLEAEQHEDGWWRIILNTNTTSAAYDGFIVGAAIAGDTWADAEYTGDGSSGIYVYGAQVELGSYPTSYIPTYGTSQTRSQEYGRTPLETYDVNEEQGVMFAEFEYLGGTDFQVLSMHNGGSLVDWLMVDSAGKLRGSVFYNGTYKVSMDSSPTTMSPNTYYKAAFRYESGNNALYLNGVKVGTNTSTFTNPPTLGYVQLGGFWQLSNTNVNCRVKQALLFNTALTDSECIALTTL